jgi:hypothetical protein
MRSIGKQEAMRLLGLISVKWSRCWKSENSTHLLGDEKHHWGKELGLTTLDDSISSSLHVFGNVVCSSRHHSELLHDPDSTGRDVLSDVTHSGNSEHC